MNKNTNIKSKIQPTINVISKKMAKFASNKYLSGLRDAFALSLPITIAGAIAILFITIIFGGWGASKTSLLGLIAHASGNTTVTYSQLTTGATVWEVSAEFATVRTFGMQFFGWINAATLGSISLYIVIFLSFSLALIRRNKSPILVTTISVAAFIVFIGGDISKFGATGMVTAIFTGIVASEVFMAIVKTGKLEIRMPASVPPAVGRSFGILLPAFITLLFAAALNMLVALPYYYLIDGDNKEFKLRTISYFIINLIQQPFVSYSKGGGDVGILFVYLLATSFLWFFGIHGSNTIDGIFAPIGILLWIDNMSGGNNVAMAQVWSGFGFVGGSGGTLPAIILSFILLEKGSAQREVAKFALPSGIFEINEPVIFGFPIVFNFRYFIPFVLGPALACIWPVIAIKLGWMNAPTLIAPWTTPPIIYGLIVTSFDWRSIIVSLLAISSLFLIYFPFVLAQKRDDKRVAKELKGVTNE